MGARWTTPASSTPTYKAMKMYRNYDGNRSTFGDTSVAASVPNPDNVAAFAAHALGRRRADRHGDQQSTCRRPRRRRSASPTSTTAGPRKPGSSRRQTPSHVSPTSRSAATASSHAAGAEHHALRRARQRDGHGAASANQPQDCQGVGRVSRVQGRAPSASRRPAPKPDCGATPRSPQFPRPA